MRRIILLACLMAVFFWLPQDCMAVQPYSPIKTDPVLEPWRWRKIEPLNGLGVRCVAEATDGSFWLGCIGSIVHYDGWKIKKFPFDESLLSQINSQMMIPVTHEILVTRNGGLLMIIDNSLVSRSKGLWTVLIQDLGMLGEGATLRQAEDGSFWLMTDRDLLHISEDFTTVETVSSVKRREHFLAFCLDESGNVWAVRRSFTGQFADLICFSAANGFSEPVKSYSAEQEELPDSAALEVGPTGKIWYVDNNQNGVYSFDPVSECWERLDYPESSNAYDSLFRDRRGTLWAGGRGELFAIRNPPAYYSRGVLGMPDTLLTVFATSDCNLWIITRDGSVYFVDLNEQHWRMFDDLHFACESTSGTRWFISVDHCVVSYDPSKETWLKYTQADGLIESPTSLTVSRDGLIWAAGRDNDAAAISVFDGKRWARFRHPEFASLIGPDAVMEARDGTIWFGAAGTLDPDNTQAGGAIQYGVTADGRVQLLKRYPGKELCPRIQCFAQTPDGLIWVGAPKIICLDPESGRVTRANKGLPPAGTHALVLDADQTLWALKPASGLFQQVSDEWIYQLPNYGLSGLTVADILALKDGGLLVATQEGISRYDGQSWMSWTAEDSFFTSMHIKDMHQAAGGCIWLNVRSWDQQLSRFMRENDVAYYTVCYTADTQPPETSVNQNPEKIAAPGNAYFSWSGQDRWSDTLASQLQFSWRLNGEEWSPFTYETAFRFTNLAGGKYVLEVRSRDKDFNVDPTPASLSFVVLPPVWRQGWFALLVLAVSGSIIATFGSLIHYREKSLKEKQNNLIEMDRLKTSFFTNLSHELNTPLGLIKGSLERLMENAPEGDDGKLLDMAMRNINRMSNLVSQMLDIRKLEMGAVCMDVVEDDIEKCVRQCFELLQPYAADKQIDCIFRSDGPCRGWFDPEKLEKIVSNLMGNAIKYTPAKGRIQLVLNEMLDEKKHRLILLVIEDTGVGIEPEHLTSVFKRFYRISGKVSATGAGIGLHLTKELVDLWGGRIDVESPIYDAPQNPGTRFTVRLPIEISEHQSLRKT